MASDDPRLDWNMKYKVGLPSLEEADPFFLKACRQFLPEQSSTGCTALDLAGGLGRHALWLAERGWKVSVVDISEVAIERLDEKARRLGLALDLSVSEVTSYQFKPRKFDLIVMYYHFDRRVCADVIEALRPAGLLICKSSVSLLPYAGDTPSHIQPLEKGEILDLLPELRILHHAERPVRDRGVVEYVGQRM